MHLRFAFALNKENYFEKQFLGNADMFVVIAVLNIFKIKKYKRNYRYFGQIFTIIKNESPHLNKIPCLYL
ncbi:MAG: hypothetical protein U9P82_03060, partial [Bacteroidota bacterium]|nr:hypothetical protein [Bacteroidota bacterium]